MSKRAQGVATVAIAYALATNAGALALHLAGGLEKLIIVGVACVKDATLSRTAIPLASAGVTNDREHFMAGAIRSAAVAIPAICICFALCDTDML